jgi:hypothetical protein
MRPIARFLIEVVEISQLDQTKKPPAEAGGLFCFDNVIGLVDQDIGQVFTNP